MDNNQSSHFPIRIQTVRYSTFFKEIFAHHREGFHVNIDHEGFLESDYDRVLREWCTNKVITNTKNFVLLRDGKELYGFSGGPKNLWADVSEMPFLEELAKKKIIRIKHTDPSTFMPFLYGVIIFLTIILGIIIFFVVKSRFM